MRKSIISMIEKEKNNHQTNRLRVINIYDVGYNLILKKFWPNKSTPHTERNGLLGENQWGVRLRCNVDNVTLLNERNTEVHRMTCYTLCTF